MLMIPWRAGAQGSVVVVTARDLTEALGPVGDSDVDPLPVHAATSASTPNSAAAATHRRTTVSDIGNSFVVCVVEIKLGGPGEGVQRESRTVAFRLPPTSPPERRTYWLESLQRHAFSLRAVGLMPLRKTYDEHLRHASTVTYVCDRCLHEWNVVDEPKSYSLA